MEIDIRHACSFTGHRPERLERPEEEVIAWLEEQVHEAIGKGFTTFITGMQRGVDIWAAEAVLKEKKAGAQVKLVAASAFKGMENRWEIPWIKRYNTILAKADDIVYISDRPGKVAFFKRNEWLVDHSARLIAVYTGAPGVTQWTIQYARKKNTDKKDDFIRDVIIMGKN